MPMLIGGLVAVLGIGAAVGLIISSGDGKTPTSSQGIATAAPSSTPGPVVSLKPPPTQGPNPTPAPLVPTPVPSTQSTGGGAGGTTQTLSNDYVSVTVPAGWTSKVEKTSIQAFPPFAGNLFLETGALDGTVTATQFIKDEIAWYKENRPDVTICGEEKDFKLHNGPAGRSIRLCYTAKSDTGTTYKAINFFAVGTVSTDAGTIYFYLSVFAREAAWDDVVDAVNPVLPSIQWKLYEGA